MNRLRHPHGTLRRINRLVSWQRLALYGTGAMLTLTGIVWLGVHYSVGAGAGELPHPLEAWSLRLHGLAAFAGLFLMGALAAAHIPQGWRMTGRHAAARSLSAGPGHRTRPFASGLQGQRRTGVLLCVLAALLVLTGYMLYYFAPETVRPALGWGHAGVGIAMGLLVIRHRRGL